MCGIIGIFNSKDSTELVIEGLIVLKNRGKDGFGVYDDCLQHSGRLECLDIKDSPNCVGHCLHSIVGEVNQPLKGKGVLVSNCEIYNWKELSTKHNVKAKNDSELLLRLLDSMGVEKTLKEIDGVYAFAYWNDGRVVIARDIVGVKPVFYCTKPGFSFASEKKALEKIGLIDTEELNPRKIIEYDIEKDKIDIKQRSFFSIEPQISESENEIRYDVKKLLVDAVKKRMPDKKLGILFSGGLDSTTLLQICRNLGKDVILYTGAVVDKERKLPQDLEWAKKAAKHYGVELKVKKISSSKAEEYLKRIVPIIEDNNPVKAGVALTFYLACEAAKKDRCKVIFSGLGSEEIFAGYERHKLSNDINKECVSGLLKMYERDLYRDDTITMDRNLELRIPFLDKKLIEYCLRIPGKYKLDDKDSKLILREVSMELGVPKEFALRKKRAAQYGSNTHKTIKRLSRNRGFKRISEYLMTFYPRHNLRLGALYSSGKDSNYALWIMQKQNYDINCLITIRSKNPDSYMYHTPNIEMTNLQAKALGIPLIAVDTKGEKEKELADLEKGLVEAKKRYRIEGVVTGALYSNYQRERIEKICDRLGLKIFSPLWHAGQERELREIIRSGFSVVLSSVAAEGLDKSWIGRELKESDVDKLVKLERKIGLNVAGEGGEYESLVLNGPNFSKKIDIMKSEVIVEKENTAKLIIKKAKLIS